MTLVRSLPEGLLLSEGSHGSIEDGACVMEAAAYIAGEGWSDHPACVSPVIAEFCRSWNDAMDDEDRQMLRPLIPLLIGTASDEATELRRSWMCLDWLCRECAPAWLDAAGLTARAGDLRALAQIESEERAQAALAALNAARDEASAARDAARDAARAAAWDAAGAALRPTVVALQASALDLVQRMAAVGAAGVGARG